MATKAELQKENDRLLKKIKKIEKDKSEAVKRCLDSMDAYENEISDLKAEIRSLKNPLKVEITANASDTIAKPEKEEKKKVNHQKSIELTASQEELKAYGLPEHVETGDVFTVKKETETEFYTVEGIIVSKHHAKEISK